LTAKTFSRSSINSKRQSDQNRSGKDCRYETQQVAVAIKIVQEKTAGMKRNRSQLMAEVA
jgi:hypothetical protein